MIDEKINKALTELESNLRSLESARVQVEKTVKSYNELNSTTEDYVNKLGAITTKIKELIKCIGDDYSQKSDEFEKDRETVIKSSNVAMGKLSNATEMFKNSLNSINLKLIINLIVSTISFVGIIILLILR